jgi:ABC-type transporter Mla subunit MlaD
MTLEELDLRLRHLSRDVEHRGEALLALELDQTRAMLDKANLVGATAAAWAPVSAALVHAWEAQGLLEEHLQHMRDLRGRRSKLGRERLLELRDLIDGRVLPEPGAGAGRSSPAELLVRSSAAVEEARRLVDTVSQKWDALVPQLKTASATLRECSETLDELGAASSAELIEARDELARLTDAVTNDPLGATPEQFAPLEADVAAVRDQVDRRRDLHADTEPRLQQARDLLAEARRAVDDAHEAHATAIAKIAESAVPAPAPIPPDLADELGEAVELVRAGAWQEGGAAVERWHARATGVRDEARRIEAANRAPIAERDELRRRLGAFQAKAQRLRLLEDPELATLHARAQRVLHTAPTDLREAADLVRRYQEGLSAQDKREAVR